MTPVLSREQIRALDRHAIDACGVPSLLLMENAGRGAADLVEVRLRAGPGLVVVVCGAGNNGGDGFVVARRLLTRGHRVRVLFVSRRDRLSGDALANHDAWAGVGGDLVPVAENDVATLRAELQAATVVVDAVFGTGLDRDVEGFAASVLQEMNDTRAHRIALDIPSGLDANTGRPRGVAVRADETVTFAYTKLGLTTSRGAEYAGRVHVVDIGIPVAAVLVVGESARIVEEADAASWIVPRSIATHKGSAGRVVAIAGSPGKTGAALLVARGALRAGAGVVTICTFPETADALDLRVLEEMTARIDPAHVEVSLTENLRGADVVVIGPGIGLTEAPRAVVEHVVLRHEGLVVVDADALTHFEGRAAALSRARGRLVLTPHPGEMARLLGTTTDVVEGDRFGAVTRAVAATGAVVLLKGARTLVGAPSELTVVNPSGTPALATAGSGDVLSGILAALLARSKDPFRAAILAAYIHGRSGEEWAAASGADRGLLAHEIADGVPRVLAALASNPKVLPL